MAFFVADTIICSECRLTFLRSNIKGQGYTIVWTLHFLLKFCRIDIHIYGVHKIIVMNLSDCDRVE